MRWLFFLLLLVNLGVLVWGIQQDSFISAKKVQLKPEVGSLRLLSEPEVVVVSSSPEHSFASEPTEALPPEPQPTEMDASMEDATPEEQSAASIAGVQERNQVLETGDAESMDMPEAGSAQAEPQLQEDVNPAPVAEADQNSVPEEPEEPVPEVAQPAAVESCGVVGPVETEILAGQILDAFEQRDVQSALRRETQEKKVGFWVIIPPYESRSKAIEAINRLKEGGIMDVRRFYRGELKNGISLGMFSRQRNAEKRSREIAAKGFAPKVLPRTREVEVFSIDYRARGENGEQRVKEALTKYPGLGHQVRDCPPELNQ